MASLLVVRGADLVLLGVETTGCTLEAGLLRAAEGATLTVTFPPQSTAEGKTPGTFIPGALLSGRSTIRYQLDAGTEVPLDVEGLLRTLVSLPIVPGGQGAVLEMPFGLELAVEGWTGLRSRPPHRWSRSRPAAPMGCGSWSSTTCSRAVRGAVRPLRAPAVEEPGDTHPLNVRGPGQHRRDRGPGDGAQAPALRSRRDPRRPPRRRRDTLGPRLGSWS